MDIDLRGELMPNDRADIARWYGWKDLTCPADIRAALDKAGGEDLTVLINSPGGSMAVGTEIASMLRRYPGRVTALYQGHGASAATIAATGADRIEAEPGALLCYHNPMSAVQGDYRALATESASMLAARDCIVAQYRARGGTKPESELEELMGRDVYITPQEAMEYGLVDALTAAPGGEDPDPSPFTAATAGNIRITAAMRQRYMEAHAGGAPADPVPESGTDPTDRDRALAYARALAIY